MPPSAVPATGVAGIGCIGGIAKHIVPARGSPWDEPQILVKAAFAQYIIPARGHRTRRVSPRDEAPKPIPSRDRQH